MHDTGLRGRVGAVLRWTVRHTVGEMCAGQGKLRVFGILCILAAAALLAVTGSASAQTFGGNFQNVFDTSCGPQFTDDCTGLAPQSGGQVEVQNDGQSQRIIEQRLRQLKCPPDADNTDSKNLDCIKDTPGASADAVSSEGINLFLSADYEHKTKDNTAFETGFDSNQGGFTVGADTRIGSDAVFGGAVSYGHTWGDYVKNGGDFDLDSVGATLYGSFYPTDQSFIDATVGAAFKDYNVSRLFVRQPSPPGVPDIDPAEGNTTGFEFSGSLSGGYDFSFGAFTVGPRLGFNYQRTRYSGFSETGSVMALTYGDQVEDSLTSVLGVQGSYAFSTDFGVVVPQLNAAYVHEFLNDQHTVHAVSANSGVDASYLTDKPDRDYMQIGAGVVFVLPNGVSPFFSYQGILANSIEETHTITLGVRLEF